MKRVLLLAVVIFCALPFLTSERVFAQYNDCHCRADRTCGTSVGTDVNLFLAQYALEQEKNKVKAKE